MKVVVTGCAGFIGSHLTEKLLDEGHEVVGIDNFSSGYREYLPNHPKFTLLEVDIADWEKLSAKFSFFEGASTVFHLAAWARIQPSILDPSLTHDANITGTKNILEMMRMCRVSSMVYSASSSYYGANQDLPSKEDAKPDCKTPYAISKYVGELFCETWAAMYDISSIRLRYFNVWGPRSPTRGAYAPVVSRFLKQTRENENITVVGDGTQKRDFTYVSDVVAANIAAMNRLESIPAGACEVYNIGTGENRTILEVAERTLKMANQFDAFCQSRIDFIPPRPGEAHLSLADISAAKTMLGWEPQVKFDEGLEYLHAYYRLYPFLD